MSNVKPAKLLLINFILGSAVKYYNDDISKPYAWNAVLVVTPQLHSYLSNRGGVYDGRDVKVGDNVTTTNSGASLEIVEIINATDTIVNCVVEDIDRSNAMLDPYQAEESVIPNGQGILFEIKENRPVLFPLPNALPGTFTSTFPTQLLTKFQYKHPLNLQSIATTQGTIGSQGTQGIQGIQGTIGTQGIQGIQGTIGTQGIQGIRGTIGTQGIQGIQGIIGTQGIQGISGLTVPNVIIGYMFKVSFLNGDPLNITELPNDWTATISGSTITINHNVNKMLKFISYFGSNTGTGNEQFRYRTPTAANEAFIAANVKLTQFSFLISSAVVASDSNGYTYVNVLF